MTATPKAVVVIADGIDDTQRALIHAAVKEISEDWWHDLPNVWVIASETRADRIRDQLLPLTKANRAKLIVLALKETSGYRWASAGGLNGEWFAKTLAAPEAQLPTSGA